MTEAPASGDIVEVELTSMAHGGEAVGRTAEGMVVFAAGGLPGERARVAIDENQGRFARGRIMALPDPASPRRVDAPCPHYGAWPARGFEPGAWCGACQWQHVAYEAQLEFKAAVLRDALERIGRFASPNVLPAIGMTDPWAYRNHLRLVADGMQLGFRGVDGVSVIPIATCPIAHPLVEELLGVAWEGLDGGIEVSLRCGIHTGDQLIAIHGGPEDLDAVEIDTDASVTLVDQDGSLHVVAGTPYLTEELGGHKFVIPADSFFQINTVMAESLVEEIRRALASGSRVRKLLDVHSGVGTFTVLCADLADEVFAIERHPGSVVAAVENSAGLDNVTLVEATAKEGLEAVGVAADAVVLDPPRSGLDRDTSRLLQEIAPRTIVYVSCEPSTLARDLGALVTAGWSLESCVPIDLFPHSFHVESVSVLRRAE